MLLEGGWMIRLMKNKVYGWESKVLVIVCDFLVLYDAFLVDK